MTPAGGAFGHGRRALVVGYGSIGRRHAEVLGGLGFDVAVVTRRAAGELGDDVTAFATLADASAEGRPALVVIASETARHAADLAMLDSTGHHGPVLVEKPLFARPEAVEPARWPALRVGYQLRFHPVVQRLKALIADQPVLAASLSVGQHLDQWRPGRLGSETYSGRADAGGGALRDLSHEIDLADWLFGPCRSLAALGGRYGDVTADSDDAWTIVAAHAACPHVSLRMNCLDMIGQRRIEIITAEATLHADLVAGTLDVNGALERHSADRNGAFAAMHRDVMTDGGIACDLPSALRTLAVIDAAERASAGRRWIDL